MEPGADLGFSRGRVEFSKKKFKNFVDLFLRLTKLIFRALPKHCFVPFWPTRKTLKKKTSKKSVWRLFFCKILTKNRVFFLARAPPSKLVYIGADGAFKKTLGSVAKNGYLKIYKGYLLGRHGVEFQRKCPQAPPPPESAPAWNILSQNYKLEIEWKFRNTPFRKRYDPQFTIKYLNNHQ